VKVTRTDALDEPHPGTFYVKKQSVKFRLMEFAPLKPMVYSRLLSFR